MPPERIIRWLKTGGDRNTFLLLTPNLTIVALAANALIQHQTNAAVTPWLLMTGLFMTVLSLFLLPQATGHEAKTVRAHEQTLDQPGTVSAHPVRGARRPASDPVRRVWK